MVAFNDAHRCISRFSLKVLIMKYSPLLVASVALLALVSFDLSQSLGQSGSRNSAPAASTFQSAPAQSFVPSQNFSAPATTFSQPTYATQPYSAQPFAAQPYAAQPYAAQPYAAQSTAPRNSFYSSPAPSSSHCSSNVYRAPSNYRAPSYRAYHPQYSGRSYASPIRNRSRSYFGGSSGGCGGGYCPN